MDNPDRNIKEDLMGKLLEIRRLMPEDFKRGSLCELIALPDNSTIEDVRLRLAECKKLNHSNAENIKLLEAIEGVLLDDELRAAYNALPY